jgi:hypothetical protein
VKQKKSSTLTYCYYYYGFIALCCALAAFSVSWSDTQSVGLPGRGISPSQGFYLHKEQHKHRINAHNTHIHAYSGIRTHTIPAFETAKTLHALDQCFSNAGPWHQLYQALVLYKKEFTEPRSDKG